VCFRSTDPVKQNCRSMKNFISNPNINKSEIDLRKEVMKSHKLDYFFLTTAYSGSNMTTNITFASMSTCNVSGTDGAVIESFPFLWCTNKVPCVLIAVLKPLARFFMQYNVFGSKHRSNVQGNEENCWSRKQTRKRRRISGFCRSIFFLAYKMLGSAVKF
jgi:hypothetical protein